MIFRKCSTSLTQDDRITFTKPTMMNHPSQAQLTHPDAYPLAQSSKLHEGLMHRWFVVAHLVKRRNGKAKPSSNAFRREVAKKKSTRQGPAGASRH